MKYLLFLMLLVIYACDMPSSYSYDEPKNEDTVTVVIDSAKKIITDTITYIEWEPELPNDTTWWTLVSNGTLYAAHKKKIVFASGIPSWIPDCRRRDRSGNCIEYRQNSRGEIVDYNDVTYEEYKAYWEKRLNQFLPIEYYKGAWGSSGGKKLILNTNRVTPNTYNGRQCDLENAVYVTSFFDPAFVDYTLWTKDTLVGIHVDWDGYPVRSHTGNSNVIFSGWDGKHLNDKSNPIFKQL